MKLNYICFLGGNTGYSVLSRALIGLMDRIPEIDLRVEDIRGNRVQGFVHLQEKDIKERKQLLHQIPTVRPDADIFYTVTEFDQPPYGSISPMRNAELILTESNFCKDVFEEFTNSPIHVIHYPIDPQYKPDGAKLEFNQEIEKFRFKFLSVFEWVMRKDPYTLIESFTEEFSPDEDVCLILRTWSKFRNPSKWIGKLAKGHNVFWLPQDVPDMPALYRSCDALVSSTWGEGFGHPFIEAAACGLKVIAPESTGILDYLNHNNSILIPTTEEKVGKVYNEIPHLIKPWFKCWKPDKEELKKAMRKAYMNEMKFITDNAVKLRNKFTLEHTEKQIREALL